MPGALAGGVKDGALTILQDVIDLDSAGEAIRNVRECGLLGHGNAHAFINAKEDRVDEAGYDLDALRQVLPSKNDVEGWLSYMKTYLNILHPGSTLLGSELWAGVEDAGLQWEQSVRDFQMSRRARMDAQTQEVYNALGTMDEMTLKNFATAVHGLAVQDPNNRGAIISWAKGVYHGRFPGCPVVGREVPPLQLNIRR